MGSQCSSYFVCHFQLKNKLEGTHGGTVRCCSPNYVRTMIFPQQTPNSGSVMKTFWALKVVPVTVPSG